VRARSPAGGYSPIYTFDAVVELPLYLKRAARRMAPPMSRVDNQFIARTPARWHVAPG
jgi:hypothetical protein